MVAFSLSMLSVAGSRVPRERRAALRAFEIVGEGSSRRDRLRGDEEGRCGSSFPQLVWVRGRVRVVTENEELESTLGFFGGGAGHSDV